MSPSNATESLFSYGTLQRRDVQLAAFGRELTGRPDSLPGYVLGRVPITDPEAAASLGESHYANVIPAAASEAAVQGIVFEVTRQELTAADQYEEDAQYFRTRVTLQSGAEAWVYLRA